jgi:hypothetical protein
VSEDFAAMATHIETMFETPANGWWRFVPCGTCNATRGNRCQASNGPARGPHARRRRTGIVLHGTLWLLANGYESDVLGEETS